MFREKLAEFGVSQIARFVASFGISRAVRAADH
jgi:hypothetical protein